MKKWGMCAAMCCLISSLSLLSGSKCVLAAGQSTVQPHKINQRFLELWCREWREEPDSSHSAEVLMSKTWTFLKLQSSLTFDLWPHWEKEGGKQNILWSNCIVRDWMKLYWLQWEQWDIAEAKIQLNTTKNMWNSSNGRTADDNLRT